MQLLTQELRASLPPLYAQDGNSNPTVYAKFFTPDSNWTWFITEGGSEGDDYLFFGYVIGFEEEWGYSALSDLQSVRGPWNLPIERDLHFKPGPFEEVIARYRKERGEQVQIPCSLSLCPVDPDSSGSSSPYKIWIKGDSLQAS